ncbi:MAG: hypothetical protein QOK48_2363 [Blastocatellia bacterium]|nr:hypothetical protein [Blastocatellia bacterium]
MSSAAHKWAQEFLGVSWSINISCLRHDALGGSKGVEPSTAAVTVRCSAI